MRRTNPQAGELPEDLHAVIHSSIDIALEVSCSTLLLLVQAALPALATQLGSILFYACVSAMCLFHNLLIHPLDPALKSDIELLESFVRAGRGGAFTKAGGLTAGDVRHVEATVDFVPELARLCNCAAVQARKVG